MLDSMENVGGSIISGMAMITGLVYSALSISRKIQEQAAQPHP